MKFRTEIGPLKGAFDITHSSRIALIGSCFADNVGELLCRDGFDAVHNPLGPLYNPQSVARVVGRGERAYGKTDFFEYEGRWHCLDFANRFQADTPEELSDMVNREYLPFARAIKEADTLIVTLGTSKVFELGSETVGNCHKLPGYMFKERLLSVGESVEALLPAIEALGKKTIVTLSPVRYPGEGLPAGSLAKAVLRVAIDEICRTAGADYFPAYEIVNDDLRDYRFYAADMRHPSDQAVEYIYEAFSRAYFPPDTLAKAEEFRRNARRMAHRPMK